MIDIDAMIKKEIENGYGDTNAQAKVCQDLILKAIAKSSLNRLEGLTFKRKGKIKELKQQDYHGKRVYIEITDSKGYSIENKMNLGVHNKLDIEQDEFCFDIAYDDEGASLLINSNEQMIAEKLKSLLRFGTLSSRYKDIFDIYYLSCFLQALFA